MLNGKYTLFIDQCGIVMKLVQFQNYVLKLEAAEFQKCM